jgi:hypothetical protein
LSCFSATTGAKHGPRCARRPPATCAPWGTPPCWSHGDMHLAWLPPGPAPWGAGLPAAPSVGGACPGLQPGVRDAAPAQALRQIRHRICTAHEGGWQPDARASGQHMLSRQPARAAYLGCVACVQWGARCMACVQLGRARPAPREPCAPTPCLDPRLGQVQPSPVQQWWEHSPPPLPRIAAHGGVRSAGVRAVEADAQTQGRAHARRTLLLTEPISRHAAAGAVHAAAAQLGRRPRAQRARAAGRRCRWEGCTPWAPDATAWRVAQAPRATHACDAHPAACHTLAHAKWAGSEPGLVDLPQGVDQTQVGVREVGLCA